MELTARCGPDCTPFRAAEPSIYPAVSISGATSGAARRTVKRPTLILPGIGNSGPDHWQTLWERNDPSYVRLRVSDWEHPVCEAWVNALEGALEPTGPGSVLIAHSLGCLLVAHWATRTRIGARAALLVAPPDPDSLRFPMEAVGFSPVPLDRLAFPSMVIASTDDPYGSLAFYERITRAWGSRLISVGRTGHINASSGLGEWPEGLSLLRQLLEDNP